jgi:hypothetical protein
VPEDETTHGHWHDEYLNGPVLPALHGLTSVGTIATYPLILVNAHIPQDIRRQLSQVAYVAQREIQGPAGYDGTMAEGTERLFILANGDRAIAMVLTALDEYYWRLTFSEDGAVKLLD